MPHTSRPHRQRRGLARGLALSLAVAALALSACGGGRAGAAPREGGTLKVNLSSAPTCLDPAVAFNGNERAVVRTLVDSLVDMRPRTGEIVPWLASSWEQNVDATAFTFHLRPDATFSDGTPVDAAAVKATFDYITSTLSSTSPRGIGYLDGYTGTKVVDPHTAQVTFSRPAVQFLAGASTSTLGILSTSGATKNPQQRCAADYVGSGPFTLASYTQGQLATVVKRQQYAWPSRLAGHSGAAHLDGIEFRVVDTSNARDGALASGQAGVALDIATQDMPMLEGAGVTVLRGTQAGMPASFVVNTTRPGLVDPVVRRAIMTGFDRASDVKAVLGTSYTPATSVLTSNLPQYADQSSAMAFDPARAASALDAAGWRPGADGIRVRDGVRLDFAVTYSAAYGAHFTSLLQLFQQQMKDIGIAVSLRNLTQSGLLGTAPSHDFDFYMVSLTDADPDIIRSSVANFLFADRAALTTSGLNDLFRQSVEQADPAVRTATYARIQQTMIDNGFVIPFWEATQLVGVGRTVVGVNLDFQSWLSFYDAALTS